MREVGAPRHCRPVPVGDAALDVLRASMLRQGDPEIIRKWGPAIGIYPETEGGER